MEQEMEISYDYFLRQKERRKKSLEAKSEDVKRTALRKKQIKRTVNINEKNYLDFIDDDDVDLEMYE